MGILAKEFLGGWVVKATVFKETVRHGRTEQVKIISPRSYQSREAAEQFKDLAVKQGAVNAFVTDKADEPT